MESQRPGEMASPINITEEDIAKFAGEYGVCKIKDNQTYAYLKELLCQPPPPKWILKRSKKGELSFLNTATGSFLRHHPCRGHHIALLTEYRKRLSASSLCNASTANKARSGGQGAERIPSERRREQAASTGHLMAPNSLSTSSLRSQNLVVGSSAQDIRDMPGKCRSNVHEYSKNAFCNVNKSNRRIRHKKVAIYCAPQRDCTSALGLIPTSGAAHTFVDIHEKSSLYEENAIHIESSTAVEPSKNCDSIRFALNNKRVSAGGHFEEFSNRGNKNVSAARHCGNHLTNATDPLDTMTQSKLNSAEELPKNMASHLNNNNGKEGEKDGGPFERMEVLTQNLKTGSGTEVNANHSLLSNCADFSEESYDNRELASACGEKHTTDSDDNLQDKNMLVQNLATPQPRWTSRWTSGWTLRWTSTFLLTAQSSMQRLRYLGIQAFGRIFPASKFQNCIFPARNVNRLGRNLYTCKATCYYVTQILWWCFNGF